MNIRRFIGKTVFVTGAGKSSGKTAFFGYVLNRIRRYGEVAYLSVGAGGRGDLIFSKSKRGIFARRGDYLLTSDEGLKKSDIDYEIKEVFAQSGVLGRLVFIKVVRGGFIEPAGPESNSYLGNIIEILQNRFKIKTILIDGAVNRVTPVASSADAGYVYTVKADRSSINSAVSSVLLHFGLSKLPLAEKIKSAGNTLYFKGALTAGKLAGIGKKIKTVIIEDFSKVFLTYGEWRKFCAKYKVKTASNPKLLFFVVNLHDIGRKEFSDALKSRQILKKIMFNPYEQK